MHSSRGYQSSPSYDDAGEELKKLSVQLPRAVHQQLKVFAIRNDTSITNLIQQMVEDLLSGQQS